MFENESIWFKILFYIHKALTTWYIPHILLAMSIFITLFFVLVLIFNWRIYYFLIRERFKMVQYYIYLFIQQKYNFFKYFIRLVMQQYKKFAVIMFLALVILLLIVYAILKFAPKS